MGRLKNKNNQRLKWVIRMMNNKKWDLIHSSEVNNKLIIKKGHRSKMNKDKLSQKQKLTMIWITCSMI